MDGVRAYWNGRELISKHGKEIDCPDWFIQGFPLGVGLDGELWMGRGQLEEATVLSAGQTTDEGMWKSTKYIVFDLPHSKKPYERRMDELRSIGLPPHVEVVTNQQCMGNDDVFRRLNTIAESGGEGMMAMEPQSLYAPGERTHRMLKVKAQDDVEVLLMEILPTGLHCLQKNGMERMVGCFQQVLDNPPAIGSVITVKHLGHYQNGTLRHPFFWRERLDVSESLFPRRFDLYPLANWTIPENRRAFFDNLGEHLGYKSLDDFYNLKLEMIQQRGGKALVETEYDGSVLTALQAVYPEHRWHPWRMPQRVSMGYWSIGENQREFVDWLGKKLNISNLDDWYKVSEKEIEKQGGGGLLDKHGGSRGRLLVTVYPEHDWKW